MKILNLRGTVGPNIYSIDHPLVVVMRVKFDDGVDHPIGEVAAADLCDFMAPEICESGWPMGLVLARLAVYLQRQINLDVEFTHLHPVHEAGVANVVFEYVTEEAGFAAGRHAVAILEAVLNRSFDLAAMKAAALEDIRQAWRSQRLLLSTEALVKEAAKRGIPHFILNANSLVQLGYGCNQQRIQDTLTEFTSTIAVDLAGNKFAANEMMRDMDMPVPRGKIVTVEAELTGAMAELGFPLVVKPAGGHQGQGVTTGLTNPEEVVRAFRQAQTVGSRVLVEEHVRGHDFRVLIINNRFVAASRREPASVLGDGASTVTELVAAVNSDPRRGPDHERPLTYILLDERAEQVLERQDLSLDSVPEAGRRVFLQTGANLSTGGTAADVTREVHPANVHLFERVAHFIGLDVAGLDVVAESLSVPIETVGGRIIEINAAPGFRMHLFPSSGDAMNVCEPVIDRLFPSDMPSRIPILAVTGTNGKTTTTRLLAHILRASGRRVGFTSSDGIYLGLHRVKSGDMTGPGSTRVVLKDPWVDTAVFEYPRGGLIRAGLGFDRCEVGIVMNVSPDHLGSRDIETIEEMAHVKSVLIRAVLPDGFAVLNADDNLVYAMKDFASGEVAFFSLDATSPRLMKHRSQQGIAAALDGDRVILYRGDWAYPLGQAADFPITFGGQAPFMIQNVLAAALGAFCHGLPPHAIRQALCTFESGVALTPGRMNLLYGEGFRVLVDYAHNIDSMRSLDFYLKSAKGSGRLVAVVGGTGDRLDADIRALGLLAGRMFDRVIVREDRDPRGRSPGATAEIFRQGVQSSPSPVVCETILNSDEAITHAVQTAQPDDLICVLGGDVEESLAMVRQFCRISR